MLTADELKKLTEFNEKIDKLTRNQIESGLHWLFGADSDLAMRLVEYAGKR